MQQTEKYFQIIASPLGNLLAESAADSLQSLEFLDTDSNAIVEQKISEGMQNKGTAVLDNLELQLSEYFEGKRRIFDIPLKPIGTEFQLKVWKQLQTISFGKTISYAKQAEAMGDIMVIRAMASANGKNPIAILIPCHRVIGSNGDLTGYAGGLWRKQKLLEHEGILPKQEVLF